MQMFWKESRLRAGMASIAPSMPRNGPIDPVCKCGFCSTYDARCLVEICRDPDAAGAGDRASPRRVQAGSGFQGVGERLERVHGIEPRSSAWKAAALPLCYTRSERRDLNANAVGFKWASAVTCRSQVVEGTGFEPVYAKRPDLQSGGFNHSPTPPGHLRDPSIDGSRSGGQKRV